MRIFEKKGLSVVHGNSKICIDGNSSEESVILTHAHSDHAKPRKNRKYFASNETISLLEKNFSDAEFVSMDFRKKISFDDFSISLIPSGHMLGSAQVKIENNSELVVTSDFKLQKTILSNPAEILSCDTLLIESTFGIPHYSFPLREKVYEEMILWINSNIKSNNFVVLGGHALSKAQELTAVSSLLCNEPPLVFKSVFNANKIYEKHKVNLGDYIELNHNLNESNVLIMPLQLINDGLISEIRKITKKNVSVALATGWNHSKHKSFPLSDHADFNQLIQYVKESNPKKVLTYHGYAKQFASYIQRRLGIPAMALGKQHQALLNEF
ncbi:MAG: MBL fold metallo-hydrolase RNA specificity domain-containing protein [Candidatus Diapherotrites archaeon]